MTQIFEVENIKCGGCLNTIREGLEQMTGVVAAQPENEHGIVTVDFDENKTSSEAISPAQKKMFASFSGTGIP